MSPARRNIPPQSSPNFVDFGQELTQSDPAVNLLLQRTEQRHQEARLSPKERERKKKEREKIRARRPFHTTYDIPVELRERIKELAEAHGVPASQIATLGLLRFVEDLARGRVDLTPYKTPSRSPRYDFNLVLPLEEFPATFGKPSRRR